MQLATINCVDTHTEIMAALNSRSSKRKIAALAKISTLPTSHEYTDEVKMLAASTIHREVYNAAKQLLWSLSPQQYVQLEKTHPFGKI